MNMVTESYPIVSNWYQHLEKGQRFLVVAFDEESELIEVQHFDGSVEEFDLDLWYEMELEPIAEPENWAGAVDVGEIEDLSTSVTDTNSEDWNSPMEEFRGTEMMRANNPMEAEEDEWGDDDLLVPLGDEY
jgi:hypothetical protein